MGIKPTTLGGACRQGQNTSLESENVGPIWIRSTRRGLQSTCDEEILVWWKTKKDLPNLFYHVCLYALTDAFVVC